VIVVASISTNQDETSFGTRRRRGLSSFPPMNYSSEVYGSKKGLKLSVRKGVMVQEKTPYREMIDSTLACRRVEPG
jgi:hypothetical protein